MYRLPRILWRGAIRKPNPMFFRALSSYVLAHQFEVMKYGLRSMWWVYLASLTSCHIPISETSHICWNPPFGKTQVLMTNRSPSSSPSPSTTTTTSRVKKAGKNPRPHFPHLETGIYSLTEPAFEGEYPSQKLELKGPIRGFTHLSWYMPETWTGGLHVEYETPFNSKSKPTRMLVHLNATSNMSNSLKSWQSRYLASVSWLTGRNWTF